MKVLGLDSATVACSAAVCDGGMLLSRRYEEMARGQSEALMPMVEDVMAEAGLRAGDLDLIAVTIGPGAFTGLRIAIATAVGLSLASGVNAAGVTTMEALAYAAKTQPQAAGTRQLVTALDSRRDDIYMQVFSEDGRALGDVEAVASDGLGAWAAGFGFKGPVTLIGDAADRVEGLARLHGLSVQPDFAHSIPDAQHVAALAADKMAKGLPLRELRPLYLRPPDAVVPKHGGRLRA